MSSFPDLNTALPASFVTPSRTSRILRPGIVLLNLVVLGAVSVVGLGIAGAVLASGAERTRSTNAAQALALIASLLSIIYVLVHGFAAKYNDPVGMIRPPELKLHATCFILARLVLIFWFVEFVTACAVVSKPDNCLSGRKACSLQIADVISSIVGFMVTGIILTALESCKYPFELPLILLTHKIKFRQSPSEDDVLDRSVSRESSFDIGTSGGEKPKKPFAQKSRTETEPLPQTPSDISEAPERPLTPLLSILPRNRLGSKSWGEEWVHLRKHSGLKQKSISSTDSAVSQIGMEKKSISTFDSAVSLSYETSSGASEYMSMSDRSSHVSMPRRAITRRPVRQRAGSRTITPSSSISNLSRRSPLSSVRSADYPHILVRPELRYCPPIIPSPHSWHSSRTSSNSQVVRVADPRSLHRQPSFSTSENFVIRGPRKNLPPLPRSRPPLSTRRSNQNVRGSSVSSRPSFDYEEKIDEHLRKIEVEYVMRSQSKRNEYPSPYLRRQPGNLERLSPPRGPIDLKSRYQEKTPGPLPPLPPTKPVAIFRPRTAHPTGATKDYSGSPPPFRRLSLGDISSGLGNLEWFGENV
ncbi:hypothetical protein VTL71DRAFT_5967 [Oculimacula yallundae]|uniref:Uncharacterized protein n=1 Tax=Oculimacula yallundae TaxID=86028 RepID=A0ABR4BYZ9_9HELO